MTKDASKMILNFKIHLNGKPTNFVEKILFGEKIHTIRSGNRWKVGDTMHMSTGARTKQYNQFNKGYPLLEKVVSVQDIKIRWVGTGKEKEGYEFLVFIDDILIGFDKLLRLVKSDGFQTIKDFGNFFNTDFDGQIIHWTDIKY